MKRFNSKNVMTVSFAALTLFLSLASCSNDGNDDGESSDSGFVKIEGGLVKVENSEDAEAKALENWLEGKDGYVLDASDFTDVEFDVVSAGFYEVCE